jgi:hypothetical protein
MTDSDDYGFFCDIETAKIAEYDKHKYYILTKKTHWEVRRMPIENVKTNLGTKNVTKNDIKNGNKRIDTFKREIKTPTHKIPDDSSTDSSNDLSNDLSKDSSNDLKEDNTCSCSFIQKIPRQVYYSFIVCASTISCVYFVMTFPVDK